MATAVKVTVTVDSLTNAFAAKGVKKGDGKLIQKTEVNGFLNTLAALGLAVRSQVDTGGVKRRGKPENQFIMDEAVVLKIAELMG